MPLDFPPKHEVGQDAGRDDCASRKHLVSWVYIQVGLHGGGDEKEGDNLEAASHTIKKGRNSKNHHGYPKAQILFFSLVLKLREARSLPVGRDHLLLVQNKITIVAAKMKRFRYSPINIREV